MRRLVVLVLAWIVLAGPALAADRPLPRDKAVPARLARLPAWQAAAVCNQVLVGPFVARAKAAGGLAPFDAEANRLGDLTQLFAAAGRDILVADRHLTGYVAAQIMFHEGNRWPPNTLTVAQCASFAPVMQRMLSALH